MISGADWAEIRNFKTTELTKKEEGVDKDIDELLDRAIPQVLKQKKFVGVSCPEYLLPHFVAQGVQIFHSSVQQIMLAGGKAYFEQTRKATQ